MAIGTEKVQIQRPEHGFVRDHLYSPTFVDGAEATITELSVFVEAVGRLLELLVGEEVRRRVLDAAGLHVADPRTRGPTRPAVLEELRR